VTAETVNADPMDDDTPAQRPTAVAGRAVA